MLPRLSYIHILPLATKGILMFFFTDSSVDNTDSRTLDLPATDGASDPDNVVVLRPSQPQTRVVELAGCAIDLTNVAGALQQMADTLADPSLPSLAVGSVNLDHFWHFGAGGAARDGLVLDDPRTRWLMLLDGAPVAWAAAAATGRSWERLAGSDLISPILDIAQHRGARVGFLGGMPDMHRRLDAVLSSERPYLDIAGYWAPGREELDDVERCHELAAEIRRAEVDVLVVGLGKPRQELWISRYGHLTGARVLLAFGASADFLAGVVQRAPVWMRKSGLEWAYRLGREPRRMARRYLVQGPVSAVRMVSSPTRSAA